MAQTSLFALASLISGASSTFAGSATFTATCTPLDVPYHAGQRQSGYSQCGTGYNQTSECYNAFLNTVQDFCLWGPPLAGLNWAIGNTEQIEVPWCMKSGHGTRLIPDGTITGAHLVVTPDYVQITGVGNLTNINIPAGDAGGKLGPHGANGQGNQVSGLVFSSAFGQLEQIHEWTSFVSYNQFCFRACKPSATTSTMCQYIDGVVGCEWNMPGNYDVGVFENCLGDSAEPIGVHGTSTFYQGASATPEPHPISIPSSSSCTTHSTISNEQVILERDVTSTDNSNESTPITVRSHWHSGTNRHSRHFTPPAPTPYTATTITFLLSPSSSSTSPSLLNSTAQAPSTLPPSILHSHSHSRSHSHSSAPSAEPGLPSSSQLSFSRYSSSHPSYSSSLHSSFSHSSLLPSSSPLPLSSFPHSSSANSPLVSPSSQPQPSTVTYSSPLHPPSSDQAPSLSPSFTSQTIRVLTSQSFFHSNSSSSSAEAMSAASSSSAPSSNPQTQIGSQCARPQGGAASVGSSGAAAPTAPLIGWEKLMLTIFAVVVGSSIGALVVL